MSTEITYADNNADNQTVPVDEETKKKLNEQLRKAMNESTNEQSSFAKTSKPSTSEDPELNMLRKTQKSDIIKQLVDFSKNNNIYCAHINSLKRRTKEELQESLDNLKAKKNVIDSLIQLSNELKDPLEAGNDELYKKDLGDLKQMLGTMMNKSYRISNGMSPEVDAGSNLFLLNKCLFNALEIGSTYAQHNYEVIDFDLKGLTDDCEANRENLTQILRAVAQKHCSDGMLDCVDPLVIYGLTVSQIVANRAFHNMKKSSSSENAENSCMKTKQNLVV